MVHTPIKGYRELSADELQTINNLKNEGVGICWPCLMHCRKSIPTSISAG